MPKISVIIPHLSNRFLRVMDSLNRQTFTDFEIIPVIDNDKSMSGAPRNLGAKYARGKYLFFCDDDLELDPECLQKMNSVLDDQPLYDFVYCDYQRAGVLSGVQNGQPWDYEKLKKGNYASTMSMVRKEAFEKIGGFDETLPRYVDWDLWLRIGAEEMKGYYLPEVLFTAYFDEHGISTKGSKDRIINTHNIWLKHKIYPPKCLSVIIPFRNNNKFLEQCIEACFNYSTCTYEIIIVNDSGKELKIGISEDIGIEFSVINNHQRLWYSGSCNAGAAAAKSKYLCFLNSDTMVGPEWDSRLMYAFMSAPGASCIGPMTSHSASPQNVPEFSKYRKFVNVSDIPTLTKIVQNTYISDSQWAKITGFCMITSKNIFDHLNGFDPEFRGGGDEADFIIRALKDIEQKPLLHTHSYVHHVGGVSYIKEFGEMERKFIWDDGRKRILDKHGKDHLIWLENDMYKNIQLKRK